ncbi:MAG: response regulator [Elusimicrobia bacterium]|nr:response regulator [Elusimicrobiota bacterium]
MALRNTIMVVDDDPLIVTLLTAKLEEAGYTITSAADANEALNQAAALKPRLILSDMQMPLWGSGADILAAIRNHPVLKETAVIFITGLPLPKIREQYPMITQDARVRLLGKPVDWVMLEQAIFELTGEYRPLQKKK